MSDIFLSYARDDKPRALAIAAILEKQGWSVWWDPKIPAGKTFAEVIDGALAEARAVVVLWSKVSVKKNWVIEEAQDGLNRDILVPVLIEDVSPPRGFKMIQAAVLWNWDGTEQFPAMQNLLSDIAQVLGKQHRLPKGSTSRARTGDDQSRRVRWTRRGLLIPLASVVVVVSSYALMRNETPKEPPGGRDASSNSPRQMPAPTTDSKTATVPDQVVETENRLPSSSVPPVAATLSAVSSPSGAFLFVDGTARGQTPIDDLEVEPGRVRLRFVKGGYVTRDTLVVFSSGSHRRVIMGLSKVPEEERVVPTPPDTASRGTPPEPVGIVATPVISGPGILEARVSPGASLYFQGRLAPSNPYEVTETPGKYVVVAEHPQWGRWPKNVILESGKRTEVEFDFNRTFQVTVSADPTWGEIFVDGVSTGRYTPAVLTLHPGKRIIEVRRDGYVSSRGAVEMILDDQSSAPVHFELHSGGRGKAK